MIKPIKNNRGFTLIELLVAIAMFGMIIVLIVNARIDQQKQSITQQQAVEMQQTVRAALYIIIRGLRQAGYNPSYKKIDTGITIADADTLEFNYVINDDGTLKTIAYSIDENKIKIDQGGGPQTLAENIQTLNFTYFDENGSDLGPIDIEVEDIRSIQITVVVATNTNELTYSNSNNTRTLSTIVYLRNLGF